MPINRIVVILTVITGLVGAVVPVLANMDTSSVAGWIAGLGAATTAVITWLLGWQKHEARQDAPANVPDVEGPTPVGDYTPGEFGDTGGDNAPRVPLGLQGDA